MMSRILISLTCIFLLSSQSFISASEIVNCNNPGDQKSRLSVFEKITEGKISFDLFISDSHETQVINIMCIDNSMEEIVFSIPVVSGNVLYLQQITSGYSHRFDIEFDLSYNFCKVFIDGKWLTSILTKKQFYYVNGINIVAAGEQNDLKNLSSEGKFFEFKVPLKVIAFGNSTTAYRKTITGVYCQRLPEYFKKQNIPVHVFNEGIGGSHTGHITDNSLHKIRHALDRFDDAVLAKNPDIVIFSFGINDSWVDNGGPEGKSRISLKDYRKNLLFMVHSLQKKNIRVILMTPNGLGKDKEPWRHERLEKYVKVVRNIAQKEKLPLIDQWKMFDEYASIAGKKRDDLLLDGVHPNDMWHEKLSGIISELIFVLIKDGSGNK
jgi:lysophospholipase L1-like esterase